MLKIVAIAAGGALGALSRFGVQKLCTFYFDGVFPLATFLVNMAGCLAIGFLIPFLAGKDLSVYQPLQAFLIIGFLGAFTTFSAFGLESWELLQKEQFFSFFLNLSLQVIGGLSLVALGIWCATKFMNS